MARIRTIKPEFTQSESIGKLSRDARLLYVQLWTIVDDAGRARAASRMLASTLYPYDDDARDSIEGWLLELEHGNHIRRYEVDGSVFLEVVKWLDHQKIDKPSKSRLPEYNGNSPKPRECSEKPRDVPSTMDLVPSTMDHSEANASGADAPIDPSIAEKEFFARGKQVLGKAAGGQLAKLLRVKGGNVALARACLETASQKENPAEYVAGAIRGPQISSKPLTEFQRKQAETNDLRAQLRASAGCETGGGSSFGILSNDQRERSSNLSRGAGASVLSLPRTSDRGSG